MFATSLDRKANARNDTVKSAEDSQKRAVIKVLASCLQTQISTKGKLLPSDQVSQDSVRVNVSGNTALDASNLVKTARVERKSRKTRNVGEAGNVGNLVLSVLVLGNGGGEGQNGEAENEGGLHDDGLVG